MISRSNRGVDELLALEKDAKERGYRLEIYCETFTEPGQKGSANCFELDSCTPEERERLESSSRLYDSVKFEALITSPVWSNCDDPDFNDKELSMEAYAKEHANFILMWFRAADKICKRAGRELTDANVVAAFMTIVTDQYAGSVEQLFKDDPFWVQLDVEAEERRAVARKKAKLADDAAVVASTCELHGMLMYGDHGFPL